MNSFCVFCFELWYLSLLFFAHLWQYHPDLSISLPHWAHFPSDMFLCCHSDCLDFFDFSSGICPVFRNRFHIISNIHGTIDLILTCSLWPCPLTCIFRWRRFRLFLFPQLGFSPATNSLRSMPRLSFLRVSI